MLIMSVNLKVITSQGYLITIIIAIIIVIVSKTDTISSSITYDSFVLYLKSIFLFSEKHFK